MTTQPGAKVSTGVADVAGKRPMKYAVDFNDWVTTTVTVEADDVDEAIEKAFDERPTDLCAHCTGWGQEWSRDMGEPDVLGVYDEQGNKID